MITLVEELRKIRDTIDGYDESSGHKPTNKKSHVVPGTPEGIVAEYIREAVEDILYKMGDMSKLSDEKRHAIEAKLGELMQFAQNELQ